MLVYKAVFIVLFLQVIASVLRRKDIDFMTKTEQEIKSMVSPLINELGYELYDVMYLKEGSEWFLRIFIDSDKGIDLDDCEKVSVRVGELLDEKDPVSTSYSLEVSSCGLERHLREKEHFEKAIGKNIEVKFFKPIDGKKSICGELIKFEDGLLVIKTEDTEIKVNLDDISSAKILFDWEE